MTETMNAMDIAFPNLGIYLTDVPKSFSIFGFSIALYGILIGLGVIFGFLLAGYDGKKNGLDEDLYWDFSLYALIFSIVGARIYYVIFAWDNYKNNLLQIFNIRNGGIAIYGAVIGGCLALYVFTRKKKVSFFLMADTSVLGLLVGQIIGRWGNFANRECFGDYTDGLFAMRLPIEAVRASEITDNIAMHIEQGANYIQVHPTFLYESAWNLALLMILLLCRKYKKFNGEVLLWYLAGYGIGRFWIEGLRTDQLLLPNTQIAVSQCVAIICIVIAVMAEIVCRIRIAKKQQATT